MRPLTEHQIGVVAAVALIVIGFAQPATAQGVRWTDAELAGVSSAVVTGRVIEMAAARDPEVGFIYTYVTIELDDVIKGRFSRPRVVLKQLGGRVGDLEMVVYDQAGFTVGEEVLLFLDQRPRDRTLRTTALWQGKWHIDRDPATGDGIARRSPFGSEGRDGVRGEAPGEEVRLLRPFAAELRAWTDLGERESPARSPRSVDDRPLDAPARTFGGEEASDDPFTLLGSGSRWHEADSNAPVLVDVQASGQPGLAGGGFAEIAAARALWNAVDASLRLVAGNENRANGFSPAQTCSDSNVIDGRLTIYFDDPCNEIGNGGTLAIGGFYSTSSDLRTVNGTAFRKITKGFVINSGGAGVQNWLTTSRCFQDIQLHEIGHAIGLGHTSTPGNIMNPTLDSACLSALTVPAIAEITGALGADDIAGLQFIYLASTTSPPSAPASLTASAASDSAVDLSWTDTSSNEDGFRLQRKPKGGSWTNINVSSNQSSHTDSGLGAGDWCYRIRSYNSAGSSAWVSSSPSCVTLGSGGSGGDDDPPAAPSNVTATQKSGKTIDLSWVDNSNNEKRFKLQRRPAGGSWTTIRLPKNTVAYSDRGLSGGTWCYRIRAEGSAGNSDYVASSPGCVTLGGGDGSPPPTGGAPAAPTDLVATALSGGRVALAWVDNSSNEKGFKLQRRVPGARWKTTRIKKNVTGHIDAGLAPGTYCYRIRSFNRNGRSGYTSSSPGCVIVN